jgi:hypothetical protein
MDLSDIITKGQDKFRTLTGPKYTWVCELHPSTYWHVEEGKQPNMFHRFMQRVCFGFKWSRIDD